MGGRWKIEENCGMQVQGMWKLSDVFGSYRKLNVVWELCHILVVWCYMKTFTRAIKL